MYVGGAQLQQPGTDQMTVGLAGAIPTTAPGQEPRRAARWRPHLPDLLAVAGLVLLFFVVHDVPQYVSAPYWLDESWVALAPRFGLGDLMRSTSSTPVGWTLLLWLLPVDYLRVVPIAFQVLQLPAAYLLGRRLGWAGRGNGILAGFVGGAVVLLMPFQQTRHDLKQYTADAAVALALLALASWGESGWSRRRLAMTVGAVPLGMLVSHTAAIMGACVFGGFVIAALVRRQWRRLGEAVGAGLLASALIAAVYAGLSGRADTDGMKDFWAAYMPAPSELPQYLSGRIQELLPLFGLPGPVLAVLLVAGVATIALRGRPATAIAVVLLPVAMVVFGVAHVYPLLDGRTSNFLMTVLAAVAGIGVAGIALGAAELGRRVLGPPRRLAVAAAAGALFLGLLTAAKAEWYRFDGSEPDVPAITAVAAEDIRSATEHVRARRGPGDVIVVNFLGRYGFAVYSPERRVVQRPYPNTVGWIPDFPGQPDLLFADQDEKAMRQALENALELTAAHGPGARVWLIRSHVLEPEGGYWRKVLADYRVELVTGGVEPVAIISRR
jgi:hypothetical protein